LATSNRFDTALGTSNLLNSEPEPTTGGGTVRATFGLGTGGARTFAKGFVVETMEPGLTELGFVAVEGMGFGASAFGKGLLPPTNGTAGGLTCCGANTFAKGFGPVVTRCAATAGAATTGGGDTLVAGGEGAGFTGASTLTKGLGPDDIGFGRFGVRAVPLNGLEPGGGCDAVVETGTGAVVILPAKGFASGVGKAFTITGVPRFIWILAGAVVLGPCLYTGGACCTTGGFGLMVIAGAGL
jgi:hypothetical protein